MTVEKCLCENAAHWSVSTLVAPEDHKFADADAIGRVQTDFGAFPMCAHCAENHAVYTGAEEPESDPDSDACAEGDYVISDAGALSSLYVISQDGRKIGECFGESINALIRADADARQFWPDIWSISDHGNASKISAQVYGDASADPARPVYCGSIGWRDCDPLGSVIGFDQSAVDARIAEWLTEERERANGDWEPEICENCDPESCACADCDCDDPNLDDLCDYGSSAFTLADMIRDGIGEGASDQREKLAELMRDGITSA